MPCQCSELTMIWSLSDPIAQRAAQRDRVHGTEALVEGDVGALAVVVVPVDVVDRLMQAAAEGDVELLEAAADREQRHLALDCGADERQRQRVACGIEGVRLDRGRPRRNARARRSRGCPTSRIASATSRTAPMSAMLAPERRKQRLTFRHLGHGRRVLAAHGVERVTVDQLGAGRNDDDRSAHAASSPATSFKVRSSARRITASASSNWACVQISGGAVTMVSKTARMMKPSRKK